MLPFAEDLDGDNIHVRFPTHVIFLCGGPISSLSEPIPRSLRDAFYKIMDNPALRKRDIILAEDITAQIAVFDWYKNILELETDLAQIVELIILFCESEGSLAELGAFAATNEIAKRLFIIVREKHWNEDSFIKLGPLRLIETEHGRDSIYVLDDDAVGMKGNSASEVKPEELKAQLVLPLETRLGKPHEPTSFDARRSGHVIKLVVGLIQEYGALQIAEIRNLLEHLKVSDSTPDRIHRYLFCAQKVGWLKKVSKGSIDYYVAARGAEAATIYSKPTAKEKGSRRRFLIRQHWQQHDVQRFKAISDVLRAASV